MLLDSNNQISPHARILPLIQKSKRQKVIFTALAEKAQVFCNKWSLLVGPSSPIHHQNIFTSWISARTIGNNGQSLYFQFLFAKYGGEPSSAIKKLKKLGLPGKVDDFRIGRGLVRGMRTFNSAKMERAASEITLCSMRNAKDIARINNTSPKPCYCCGIFENNHNLGRGGIYYHYFIQCAPAAFLTQFLKIITVRIFGFSIEINLELLIFNELPYNRCKLLSEDQKKTFFCILNAYKTTLYGLFYLRPASLTGEFLLFKFKSNLDVASKIALDRNSNLMKNINCPSSTGRTFLSFYQIRTRVMNETSHLRRYDNETRRALFLHQNDNNSSLLNSNIPHQKKRPKIKTPSIQKKQILIREAFERLENKKFTNDGNLELVKDNSTS